MSWLPDFSRERDPRWEQYHVSTPPYVHPRKNQFLEAIQALAPAIKQYVERKRADEVANAVMNMEQPPRAEAVDPSLQGAPATQPFRGGAQGMQVAELYRKQQEHEQAMREHQQDRAWKIEDRASGAADEERKARLDEANIARLNAPESGVPVDINGQTYRVTPNAALDYYDRQHGKKAFEEVKTLTGHDWSEWNRLAETDLKNLHGDGSGNLVGQFVIGHDVDKNPIYQESSIPVELFQQSQEKARRAVGQSPVNVEPNLVGTSPQSPTSNPPADTQSPQNSTVSMPDSGETRSPYAVNKAPATTPDAPPLTETQALIEARHAILAERRNPELVKKKLWEVYHIDPAKLQM